MRHSIIRIHWNEPLLIEDAIESSLSLQSGLYYITRLFGAKETSLYIGKASRTIRERLHSHDWVHDYRGKIYVRIGEIVYPSYYDEDIIDHAESALIFENGDILVDNTDKIKSYSYSQLYRVENIGDYFELKDAADMYSHPEY